MVHSSLLSRGIPDCIYNSVDAMKIMDQMEEALFWFDEGGNILGSNRACSQLLRLDSNQLSKITIFDIFNDVTPIHWFAYIKRVLDAEEVTIKAMLRNRMGADASVKIRLNKYQDHFCAFVKKTIEEPIESERVNRVAYEYDRLLYRLSHDLRSPILTLKGLINLTKREADLTQRELLQLMEETVEKQCSLLSDIHHLSLVDTTTLKVEPIFLPKVIDDIVNEVSDDSKNISWAFDFDLRDKFYSDEYFVKRLISPIIHNAIQFSTYDDHEAQIRISLESVGGKCYVRVEDNGVGVSSDFQDKVFEMFFKGSEISKGSGLGLYLAKLSAKKLNGAIKFDSTLNGGTIVEIQVPSLQFG